MTKNIFRVKAELIGSAKNVRVKIIKPPFVDSLQLSNFLHYRARAVVI